MQPLATDIVLKNDIKAIFIDENEACVIYDIITAINISDIPCVEWIKTNNGKITSTNLRFNKNSMRQVMQELRNEKV